MFSIFVKMADKLEALEEKVLHQVLSVVSNAVVFLDDHIAECIHWHNGFSKLMNAGALEIRNILEEKVRTCFVYTAKLDRPTRLSALVCW